MHIATKTLKSIQNVMALLKHIEKHKNVRALIENIVLYAYSNKNIEKHIKRRGIIQKSNLWPHLAPNLL